MTTFRAVSPSPTSLETLRKPPSYIPPYQAYVNSLCSRYPSLINLYDFLSSQHVSRGNCRVVAIDFLHGSAQPIIRQNVDINCLENWIREETLEERKYLASTEGFGNDRLLGRILIIEDLTKEVVELLGSKLDIDPLFFSLHLHAARRTGMQQQTPDEATLPSRLASQHFTNISYHRSVTSDSVYPLGGRLLRDTGVDRKLVFLRSTTIGLAQHCASIIRVRNREGFWLSLILVDPAISDKYYVDGRKHDQQQTVQLQSRPFLGEYEDFLSPPSYSECLESADYESRGGMLHDLVHYWRRRVPACFDPRDPSLQSLAYYPHRIVAAEWVKYAAVMQFCVKQYEYQNDRLPDLDKFNKDLRELQGWRRRSMNSQGKVKSILRLLRQEDAAEASLEKQYELRGLVEDFELISTKIDDAGRRLENMLPVVMTLVQITDARRSFDETANISRLTVLALVFVPLTFVASLFSMNTETLPGSQHFWLYFAVAVPVTILVIFIAKPPISSMKMALAWIKAVKVRKARPAPGRRPTFLMSTGKEPEA